MNIDILTLFPDSVDAMLNVSILGRAKERGYIAIRTHQIREYTTNKQMQVDDYPYGGGRGAVMQADPLYRCLAHIKESFGTEKTRTIYLSPCGETFSQGKARQLLADYDHLILVCGHHGNVALWRKKQAMLRTLRRRPDMFREADFMGVKADRRLLAEVYEELKREKKERSAASQPPVDPVDSTNQRLFSGLPPTTMVPAIVEKMEV